MADKEFTQICKEILEFNTKFQEIKTEILQSANNVKTNTAQVANNKQSVDEAKSDIDTKKADFDEKYPILERLESQIEPTTQKIDEFNQNKSSFDSDFSSFSTKNSEFLEKVGDFNKKYTQIDTKHSETLQKADEIAKNKKLFDVDFTKFKSDFEGLNTLLKSLEKLKTDVQSVLDSGVVNDASTSSTQTYSSQKIAEVLSEKQREFDQTIQSINQKISNVSNTADNEKSVLEATKLSTPRNINKVSFDGTEDITITDDTKLGKDEQAKDSALLEGRAASEFAASTHNHDEVYLGKTATAEDSNKLGGSPAEDYLKKADANFVTKETIPSEIKSFSYPSEEASLYSQVSKLIPYLNIHHKNTDGEYLANVTSNEIDFDLGINFICTKESFNEDNITFTCSNENQIRNLGKSGLIFVENIITGFDAKFKMLNPEDFETKGKSLFSYFISPIDNKVYLQFAGNLK
ncbi:hypothetical protein [Campylobacter sp. RM16192]|uniref:hypothetical protein n=1 Tax=Campylobacter sp. RM16192 TaxID=1660080 RepID=UPI00145232CD|nr:hypothetical protein [Campylobacter sp. RM16192]QCD52508.1 hypothetical protein CDOMC_0885 [Campylobacter sp. RM16192]